MQAIGQLSKMHTSLEEGLVQYSLRIDEQLHPLNAHLGKQIRLEYLGQIHCIHCGRKTKKSFSQGYCYPCFTRLARCDNCIIKPETCHHDAGTCREPDWAETFCFQDHIVYLANSSGLKVGITRIDQVPTRWMDQGAIQAIPMVRVSDRKLSGLVESFLAQDMADKTNWRAMLKGQVAPIDLEKERQKLIMKIEFYINNELQLYEINRYSILESAAIDIRYPVMEYPIKVTSLNFDKNPLVEGTLNGIKGQYLILDTGVINLRKFGGYQIEFSCQ